MPAMNPIIKMRTATVRSVIRQRDQKVAFLLIPLYKNKTLHRSRWRALLNRGVWQVGNILQTLFNPSISL
jgi:hypothetical protein